MRSSLTLLSYDKCGTCKKAMAWLSSNHITFTLRPIVDEGPTLSELKDWTARAGIPLRKWLNTSGQSYRAIGKEKILTATDAQLREWLSRDGKLIKRPVLIHPKHILVGFQQD